SPDGQVNPDIAAGPISINSGASAQATVAFGPGTRMEYLDEYVVGLEHDFGQGVIFTARYTDRRIKRIVEDMAALSPEAAEAGLAQQFLIGNPGNGTDIFTNPIQFGYSTANGDSCPITTKFDSGQLTDANGNVAT